METWGLEFQAVVIVRPYMRIRRKASVDGGQGEKGGDKFLCIIRTDHIRLCGLEEEFVFDSKGSGKHWLVESKGRA